MFFVANIGTNSKHRPPLQESNVKREMKTRRKQWRKKKEQKQQEENKKSIKNQLVR